jgi:hypothetical protein
MIAQGDKNGDQKLSGDEMSALADEWFNKLDTENGGKLSQEQFTSRFATLLPAPGPAAGGGRGGRGFGAFVGGGLFTATDMDKDGTLTRAEFKSAFEKWATDFDTDKSGALTQEKLVAGLNNVLPRPNFGPRQAAADDNTGFSPIFDGKTLKDWDGNPKIWRVEDGTITGETTAENPITVNTFLIWRGGTNRDFEFKTEFKLSETANSGVQIRSSIVSDVGQWTMKGYQADMDGANQFTGQVYEERGRGFLAPRGQFTRVVGRGQTKLIGSLGDAEALKALLKPGDWNHLHIYARGNTIVQTVNGHVMSGLIDEDEQGRALEGLLGLQIHMGPPMKVQFRNLLYKPL